MIKRYSKATALRIRKYINILINRINKLFGLLNRKLISFFKIFKDSQTREDYLFKIKVKLAMKLGLREYSLTRSLERIKRHKGRPNPIDYVSISVQYANLGNIDKALEVIDIGVSKFPYEEKPTDQDLRDWLTLSKQKANLSLEKIIKNKNSYLEEIKKYKNDKTKRKIAVFSAISGGYDSLKPPLYIDNKMDYILFTDTPVKTLGVHKVVPMPFQSSDNTRSARFVKTNTHKLLKEYDYAIWVDSNLLITGEIRSLLDKVRKKNLPFGAMRHAVRESPFAEMEACIRQKRDDFEVIQSQKNYYTELGYDTKEMIESNVLVYNLKNKKTIKFLEDWWSQIDKFSKRDQFSINYCLDKNKLNWKRIMDYPNTSRNNPSFALTDHGSSDKSLDKALNIIGYKVQSPDIGLPYASVKEERLLKTKKSITVVVCVHNAPEDTQKCINSIKKHKTENINLIIIDDGSNTKTKKMLEKFSLSNKQWVRLIRHNHAHGYTRSASEGMKKSDAYMTIILNSDTIVTKDWANKMLDVLDSTPGTGIVGPLSSAASHQSVPNNKSSQGQTAVNELPSGQSIEDMNSFAEKWSNVNNFPRVPLVHGFCFGVKNELIDKIGTFDMKNFPKGYGEENDYCFRAADAGYGLVIATNTYVYHAKSKSFIGSERIKLMEDGMNAFIRKHGSSRIERAVTTMQENPVLAELRSKYQKLYK